MSTLNFSRLTQAQKVLWFRLAIGLAQGAALYLLFRALSEKVWPATNGLLFAPLLVIFLYVPLIANQAMVTLRRRTYLIWIAIATITLAAVAFHDIWHAWPADWTYSASRTSGVEGGNAGYTGAWVPHIIPSFSFFALVTAGLFISHTLIVGGDSEGRFVATYPTHYDMAWKHGIQVILTAAFVLAFWLFLLLGAELFEIIKLTFLKELVKRDWFLIPAIAMATSAALHITDVNAGLIRGTRALALTLLSWLLPLLSLLVWGFLCALPFTGVDLLWDTNYGAALMLISAAILLVLINAVYQDGTAEHAPHKFLRYVTIAASCAPVLLVTLAAYAIALRINQHGWTDMRVYAFACLIVAACYAIGYFYAVFRRGPWLKTIETWNFYAALLVLAVILALLTPIADPSRIAVSSQMARFERGEIDATTLDYMNLRWNGGRFGKIALEGLANYEGKDQDLVRKSVEHALKSISEYEKNISDWSEMHADNIKMLPDGAKLPRSFLEQVWKYDGQKLPSCLQSPQYTCLARFEDLNGDGTEELLILEFDSDVYGFTLKDDGDWELVGDWSKRPACISLENSFKSGHVTTTPPTPPVWPDLKLGDTQLEYKPPLRWPNCSKKKYK